MDIIRFQIISIDLRPKVLKARCKCDTSKTISEWLIKSNKAVCSYCGREHYGSFYTVTKAKCKCDTGSTVSDWLVGYDNVTCAYCGRTYKENFVAINRKAAKCKCDTGNTISDWFIKENEDWVCSYCGNTR